MNGFNKQTKLTVLILLIVFASLLFWNLLRNYLIEQTIKNNPPISTVSTVKAVAGTWQPSLSAVGTLASINSVSLSTQQAGNVVKINFASGQMVKKDDLLVQLDDRQEQAQLQNNIAALKLAEITYQRNKALAQQAAVSAQALDEASARYLQAQASVAQTQAIIDYKKITAPYDGKLGIRNVSLGQYVRPGDALVPLEAMDPLYVNFYLPEQHLHQLYVGQPITISVDAAPNRIFGGKINALNALVDLQTHNIFIQATVPNTSRQLYPGLFARTKITLPAKRKVVFIPQTAINYSLYGNTVYVVKRVLDKKHKEKITVHLREVETGEQGDNKVIVTKGLKAGEEIVSSGQSKLINGQTILVNNSVQPT